MIACPFAAQAAVGDLPARARGSPVGAQPGVARRPGEVVLEHGREHRICICSGRRGRLGIGRGGSRIRCAGLADLGGARALRDARRRGARDFGLFSGKTQFFTHGLDLAKMGALKDSLPPETIGTVWYPFYAINSAKSKAFAAECKLPEP